MTLSSSPQQRLSPNTHYDQHSSTPVGSDRSSPGYPITRTVAIIKPHALRHRFDIERRIQEASFEIVKERQMEFDTETDPDTLYELFGEDAASFSEGPVWVYVLERRRAVEVFHTLMGDRDPEFARKETPNSLRALYGVSAEQNGIMGSPDVQTAETQIASLFVSSPIFPTTDLPEDKYGTVNSVSSSVLAALKNEIFDGVYAPSDATNPSTVGGSSGGGSKVNSDGKPTFRARPIPATNSAPDIVPRMTRSAALRAGLVVEKKDSGPRTPLSKERLAKTFENIPGHKRAEVIQVASTAAPTIAPRMTRAASLRLGVKPADTSRRRTLSTDDTVKKTFEGVPGHKRRDSIAVASTKAPTVAPRLNKSASLRAQKEQAPPSSFMFRGASTPAKPVSSTAKPPAGISRSTSESGPRSARPSVASTAPTPRRPASQAGQAPVSRYAVPRSSSVAGHRPDAEKKEPENGTATPAAPKRRLSTSTPASIAPKMNRSAALRAAKQEADNAAAAAAATKRAPRPRAAPSSFKPITAV